MACVYVSVVAVMLLMLLSVGRVVDDKLYRGRPGAAGHVSWHLFAILGCREVWCQLFMCVYEPAMFRLFDSRYPNYYATKPHTFVLSYCAETIVLTANVNVETYQPFLLTKYGNKYVRIHRKRLDTFRP